MVLVMIAGQIDGINGKGFIGWAPLISSTQSPVGALPSPWLHWFSLISSLSLEEKNPNEEKEEGEHKKVEEEEHEKEEAFFLSTQSP